MHIRMLSLVVLYFYKTKLNNKNDLDATLVARQGFTD